MHIGSALYVLSTAGVVYKAGFGQELKSLIHCDVLTQKRMSQSHLQAPHTFTVWEEQVSTHLKSPLLRVIIILANFKSIFVYDDAMDELSVLWNEP